MRVKDRDSSVLAAIVDGDPACGDELLRSLAIQAALDAGCDYADLGVAVRAGRELAGEPVHTLRVAAAARDPEPTPALRAAFGPSFGVHEASLWLLARGYVAPGRRPPAREVRRHRRPVLRA